MRSEMIVWACVALVLMGLETIAPGIFMLWLGLAAGGTFVLVWLVPGLAVLWQVAAFAILSFISVAIYWNFIRRADSEATDQPLLNRRGEQLVDRVLPLESAIVNGRGRVKIGDAFWTVQGPDLPVNTLVRVIALDSMVLKVTPAE